MVRSLTGKLSDAVARELCRAPQIEHIADAERGERSDVPFIDAMQPVGTERLAAPNPTRRSRAHPP